MFLRKTSDLRKELLAVNGIGPETADSILLYAANKPVFVVDAYTKRMFSRHGFIKADATYDQAQHFFVNNLPKDKRLFNEYHALIVELGKNICKTKPKCEICPLNTLLRGPLSEAKGTAMTEGTNYVRLHLL
jgi:endonuclease-3 related protein